MESEETKCSFIVVTPSYITPGVTFMHTKEICGDGEGFHCQVPGFKSLSKFYILSLRYSGKMVNGMILEKSGNFFKSRHPKTSNPYKKILFYTLEI